MLGLIVTAILAGIWYFVDNKTGGDLYLDSMNFLFKWYIFSSIAIFVIFVGHVLLHNLMSGLFSPWVAFFALARGMLIGGAYLLHNGLAYQNSAYDWNFVMIVFGGILIVLSLCIFKIWITKTNTETLTRIGSQASTVVNKRGVNYNLNLNLV